jgi:hypothetical protein
VIRYSADGHIIAALYVYIVGTELRCAGAYVAPNSIESFACCGRAADERCRTLVDDGLTQLGWVETIKAVMHPPLADDAVAFPADIYA